MPAHRSITAFRFMADGALVLSAVPEGASHWALPISLALHAAVIVLVVSLHVPPPTSPMVVPVELALLEAAAEPSSSLETAEDSREDAQPAPVPETAVEQEMEPAPQPLADMADAVTAVPAETPTPSRAELPVPIPAEPLKPEPARPVLRPPPKPVRTRSPPVASPRSSRSEPAAERSAQSASLPSALAQPVQAAAPTPTASSGSDRQAADYFGVVQARLARYKIYPRPARLTRQEGTVQVRFTVISDGTITGWSIVQGSGHDILDQAAEDMIRRASPLPPIPAEMGRDHLDITLPVRYALE